MARNNPGDRRSVHTHWSYYVAFEADLTSLSRYIEFEKDNFNTYSIELARILLAATSEVDVLLRSLTQMIAPERKAERIDEFRPVCTEHIPALLTQVVVSQRFKLSFTPWASWRNDQTPAWWRANNKVKHERSDHFQLANLNNALNSVAALLALNMHYALKILENEQPGYPYDFRSVVSLLSPGSEFFRIDDSWAYFSD